VDDETELEDHSHETKLDYRLSCAFFWTGQELESPDPGLKKGKPVFAKRLGCRPAVGKNTEEGKKGFC
jgi:hypothetical protein